MVCALQKALELFPKDSLSAIEVRQKIQYETGLKVTSKPRLIRVTAIEKRPWEMAETMRREPTLHENLFLPSSKPSRVLLIPCHMHPATLVKAMAAKIWG